MVKKESLFEIIRWLYYSLIFLTPLVMSSQTSEMFEFNKMMLIYLVTLLVSTLFSIHYILHRPKLYLPFLLKVLVIFFLTQLISLFYSIDFLTSLWGYYGRWNGGVLSILSYILLFFVFIQVFHKRHIERILQISLLSSTIVILWGLPARLGGDLSCLLFTENLTNACWTAQFQPAVRMFSTLGQPNWLGAYLAIHFFIGFYLFLNSFLATQHSLLSIAGLKERIVTGFNVLFHKNSSNFVPYLYGGYLVLNILGLVFTKSRSSLIAVGVSICIGIILLSTTELQKGLKRLYRGVLIVLLLVATYYAIGYISTSFAADVPEQLQITDSFTIRQIVWKGAVELGILNPVVGTGPETFAYSYYSVKPVEHNQTSEWDFVYNKAHNEFLNYLANTGFLGFIAYLAVVIVSYSYISKKLEGRDHDAALFSLMMLGAYTTIQITNFFGFSTSTIQIFFYLIPAISIVSLRDNSQKEKQYPVSLLSKFLIVFVVFTSSYVLWNVISYYRADLSYKQAQIASSKEEYQTAAKLFVKALKLKYDHVYEDKLSTALAHLSFESSFGKDKETTTDLMDLSRASSTDALKKSPDNLQYWRTRAKNGYLYFQITGDIGELEKAVESMKYTTILAPNDAQSYYMLGLFYSLLHAEEAGKGYDLKAEQALNRAIELRPNYVEAKELLQ